MDALRKEVIAEHYRLIQQLETKYTDQINQLLKQKALVHLVLQEVMHNYPDNFPSFLFFIFLCRRSTRNYWKLTLFAETRRSRRQII